MSEPCNVWTGLRGEIGNGTGITAAAAGSAKATEAEGAAGAAGGGGGGGSSTGAKGWLSDGVATGFKWLLW